MMHTVLAPALTLVTLMVMVQAGCPGYAGQPGSDGQPGAGQPGAGQPGNPGQPGPATTCGCDGQPPCPCPPGFYWGPSKYCAPIPTVDPPSCPNNQVLRSVPQLYKNCWLRHEYCCDE